MHMGSHDTESVCPMQTPDTDQTRREGGQFRSHRHKYHSRFRQRISIMEKIYVYIKASKTFHSHCSGHGVVTLLWKPYFFLELVPRSLWCPRRLAR